METLELNKGKKNERSLNNYDEILDYGDDDKFVSTGRCDCGDDAIVIKKLNYESSEYDYFIAENDDGYHNILRNKK